MANGDSPYGINVHVASTEVMDRCRDLGVGWLRADFDWNRIESEKGHFEWTVTDRVVADAEARGLSILVSLAYSPGWANGGQPRHAAPRNPQDWADFVTAVVDRYKARVRHWGMWNEPNLQHFWSGSREQYIEEILAVGSSAVKNLDGGLVLAPDLAHLQGADWNRWRMVVEMATVYSLTISSKH